MIESDREQLISRLQEVEDWLYEDGEDETKGVYIAKLDELKKVDFVFSSLLSSFFPCLKDDNDKFRFSPPLAR